jgi:hypothetical protein
LDKQTTKKKITFVSFGKFCFLALFLFVPSIASAANLVISPSSKTVNLGEIFTINVNVSSPNENINAVSGNIKYNSSNLDVVSVSKASSIIDFWSQEPTFSNQTGTINFEGVALSTGYQGSAGNVVTITLKSKKTGNTLMDILSGSVLANDGYGTDVTDALIDGTINVLSGSIEEEEEESVDTTPKGIIIKSSTHPNEDQWYSNDTVKLTFDISNKAASVQTILSEVKGSTPSILYSPPIEKKTVEDLDDGILYFNIRQKIDGSWGKIYSRKIKIDHSDPYFKEVVLQEPERDIIPIREIVLDAADDVSGVEGYRVIIDGQLVEEIKATGYYEYQTPNLHPGEHEIIIEVYDFAGNTEKETLKVEVGAIDAPKITKITEIVNLGEEIIVEGVSNSDKVILFVGDKEVTSSATVSSVAQSETPYLYMYEVDVDDSGKFKYIISDITEPSKYLVWAQARNINGASSYYSEKHEVLVKDSGVPGFLSVISKYLSIIVIVIALLVVIIIILLWLRHRVAICKKRMERRKRNPEHLLYDELELLQTNVDSHLEILHRIQRGTKLTKRELAQIGSLMNQLKRTEIMIQRSLDGVGVKEVFKPGKDIADIQKKIKKSKRSTKSDKKKK